MWAGASARLAEHGADPGRLAHMLARARPTSLVLVPALLKLLVEYAAAGAPVPPELRFVAVGGAPVSGRLLERARALGLPVFQGYGLSEATSVVSLNLPGASQPASVGRALPHAGIRIDDDGEVLVRGALFLGYVGGGMSHSDEIATGDLGAMDAEGYLHIRGRKKTAFCTAYGRNVSPEWVESELTGHAAVTQAAVFGEGRTFNVAVLVANRCSTAEVVSAVAATNRELPAYARVRRWVLAQAPFTVANGLIRAAGTLDRGAVATRYHEQIRTLYEDTYADHVL